MTIETHSLAEPPPELRHRRILPGRRASPSSRAPNVWDACTNPERLRRWYVPVTGDLRVGGTFAQTGMGSGQIVRCEPPHLLRLSLGGGADEIELQLSSDEAGATMLQLEHATTIDQHEIGGQLYDAIFCTGGGYYPRFVALDRHLRSDLPRDYDPLTFHERSEMRPIIERGSAAMTALLAIDVKS